MGWTAIGRRQALVGCILELFGTLKGLMSMFVSEFKAMTYGLSAMDLFSFGQTTRRACIPVEGLAVFAGRAAHCEDYFQLFHGRPRQHYRQPAPKIVEGR